MPESANIQLWLLVSYAPAPQALAGRYQKTGSSLDESVSSVVMAFLETLHALGETRLADPCLALEVLRDTQRHLANHQGMWASNHAERVVATPDESIHGQSPDGRARRCLQALQELIQDMPISGAERGRADRALCLRLLVARIRHAIRRAYKNLSAAARRP